MPDRREKIEALLDSPVAGERAAARAALDRVAPPAAKPANGSAEWKAAMKDWTAKIQFCASHLNSPLLTRADIVAIRNISRNAAGDPWAFGADALLPIHRKLSSAVEK